MESALEVLSNAATLVRQRDRKEMTSRNSLLSCEQPEEDDCVMVIQTPNLQTPALSEITGGGEVRRDYPPGKLQLKSPSAALTNTRLAGRQAHSPIGRPGKPIARISRQPVQGESPLQSDLANEDSFEQAPAHPLCNLRVRKLDFSSHTSAESAVEDHFRRSLQKINLSPALKGSNQNESLDQGCRPDPVDDHFTKALGKVWLELKASSDISD